MNYLTLIDVTHLGSRGQEVIEVPRLSEEQMANLRQEWMAMYQGPQPFAVIRVVEDVGRKAFQLFKPSTWFSLFWSSAERFEVRQ